VSPHTKHPGRALRPTSRPRSDAAVAARTTDHGHVLRGARLIAAYWPGTDQPLLLLEVDPSAIPRLRPGFVRNIDGDSLTIPHHPHAALRANTTMGTLAIHGHDLATVTLPASWAITTTAVLAVLPTPQPPPSSDRHPRARPADLGPRPGSPEAGPGATRTGRMPPAHRFLHLLEAGVALVAEIDVQAASAP